MRASTIIRDHIADNLLELADTDPSIAVADTWLDGDTLRCRLDDGRTFAIEVRYKGITEGRTR